MGTQREEKALAYIAIYIEPYIISTRPHTIDRGVGEAAGRQGKAEERRWW